MNFIENVWRKMKRFIFFISLVFLLLPLSAQPRGEVGIGFSMPHSFLTLDGDGVNNDKSDTYSYDFDAQFRYSDLSGLSLMFDIGLGLYENKSEHIKTYLDGKKSMFEFNLMGGVGIDFLRYSNYSKFIVGPVLGLNMDTYTTTPVYQNQDKDKVTYEFNLTNIFIGLDVYYSHTFTQNLGFYLNLTGYAGIGQASYTKKVERKDSNNAWSTEEKKGKNPSSYVWAVQPKAGFIFKF